MTRLDELLDLRQQLEREIERERAQLWRMAHLRDVVAELLEKATTTTTETLEVVAAEFDVDDVMILGTSRMPKAVAARQVAAWMLHEQGMSYSAAGRALGRDHTTVRYSCHRVATGDLLPVAERLLVALARRHRHELHLLDAAAS